MAPSLLKKRKLDETLRSRTSRPTKKFRKQQNYSSGSSSPSVDEFEPTDLADSDASNDSHQRMPELKNNDSADKNPQRKSASTSPTSNSESNSDSESELESGAESNPNLTKQRSRTKRHDPDSFSNSMTAILSSKLTTSQRSDPVLARSKDAAQASHELAEGKLELKARRALREEKRKLSEKGRVRDVLLGDRVPSTAPPSSSKPETGTGARDGTDAPSAAEILEQERRLRKTAQRGVVKLFNAVRAAQVKGEQAAREARAKGTVGMGRREEKVGEMSREGFLALVAGGGKK